jgi:hypothetical protein
MRARYPGAEGFVCTSAWTAFLTAALHPDQVLGIVNIATWVPFLTPPLPWRDVHDFDGYAEFFFGESAAMPPAGRAASRPGPGGPGRSARRTRAGWPAAS